MDEPARLDLVRQAAASTGRTWLHGLAPACLALVACLPVLGDWCILSPDSFVYLRGARSMHETLSLPAERTMTPPGLSVVIAPLFAFGDMPFTAVRVLNTCALAATAVLAYLLFRREMGEGPALLVGALSATSAVLVTRSATLLAEPVYTPMALGCVLLACRWHHGGAGEKKCAAEIVAGGLAAAATSLVRSMGLVVGLVMAAALLTARGRTQRERLWQTVLFAIAFAAPHAAWTLRQSAYPDRHDYGDVWTTPRPDEEGAAGTFALQLRRLFVFGPQRLADIKAAMVPHKLGWPLFHGRLDSLTTWLIGGAVMVMAIIRWLRSRSPIDAYVLLTLALLALWPWPEGVRLVSPLSPIFLGYAVWTGTQFLRWISNPRARRAVGVFTAAAALFVYCADLVATYPQLALLGERSRARLADSETVAAWINTHVYFESGLLCITAPGDNAKLTVLAACYQARRSFPVFWSPRGDEPPPVTGRAVFVFLHEGIDPPAPGLFRCSPIDRVDAFDVFRCSAE